MVRKELAGRQPYLRLFSPPLSKGAVDQNPKSYLGPVPASMPFCPTRGLRVFRDLWSLFARWKSSAVSEMLDTDCDSYMDMLLGRLEHVMLCTGVNIDIWNPQVSGSKIFLSTQCTQEHSIPSNVCTTTTTVHSQIVFLPYKFETLPVLNANCLFSQLASAPCYLCLWTGYSVSLRWVGSFSCVHLWVASLT